MGTEEGQPQLVSIVIPAHDAGRTIGAQLRGLAAQTFAGPMEIIVVGNRCYDDTAAVVASFTDTLADLIFVTADERIGCTYARNAGVDLARGGLLLFCDADDAVDPGWVAGMVAALEDADLVGGALEPLSGAPSWIVRTSIAPVRELPVAPNGLRHVVGASVGYRRDVHDALGGWDERFVVGADDVAFSLSAQRHGFRLGFAEDAVCNYRLRTTLREVASQQQRYGQGRARLTAHYLPELDRGLLVDVGRTLVSTLRQVAGARSVDDLRIAYVRTFFHAARTVEMVRLRRRGGRR